MNTWSRTIFEKLQPLLLQIIPHQLYYSRRLDVTFKHQYRTCRFSFHPVLRFTHCYYQFHVLTSPFTRNIFSYFSEGLRLTCVAHVTVQRCRNEENGHRRNGVRRQLREHIRNVWGDRVLNGVRAVRSSGLQGTGLRDGDLENEEKSRQSFGAEGH